MVSNGGPGDHLGDGIDYSAMLATKYHAKAAIKLVLTVGTRNPSGKVVRVFLCNFVRNLYLLCSLAHLLHQLAVCTLQLAACSLQVCLLVSVCVCVCHVANCELSCKLSECV